MSLFKAREWWQVDGRNEQEDASSLAVGSLTEENENTHQIIVGSLKGIIQVYQPTARQDASYGVDDLLVEQQLSAPVLQVACGRFLSGPQSSSAEQLVVLHPRQLTVYQLSRKQGLDTQGDSFVLSMVYQHTLARSAYSFTVGHFGGVKSKEYIAVLSLDGVLSVFEQDSHSFSRFLPGFLLPGPIEYVERNDRFVVCTSEYSLESFKYQDLATATDDKVENQNANTGRRISADWKFGIGEPIHRIQVIQSQDKDEPASILVLSKQTLTSILDTGSISWSKRFDFTPVNLTSYPSLMFDNRIISLVVTDTDTLLVYDNITLRWAAQLPYRPHSLCRGKFWDALASGMREGLVVLLGEESELSICYLGTDPTIHTPPPPDTREVNYEDTDRELAKLSGIIRQSQKTGNNNVSNKNIPQLKVETTVSSQMELCHFPSRVFELEQAVPMVQIAVKLSTTSPLTRVRVSLLATTPLHLSQETISITSLTDTETIKVFAYLYETFVVSSLEVKMVVTFLSSNGVPQSQAYTILLPLSLVVKPCPPIKDADFKVTLSTNKPAVSLLEIFPEFVLDSSMANAAGFQIYGGPSITVLSSKTSQRYRLQSENLPSLWIITQQIQSRLKQRFTDSSGKSEFECSYTSSLPLQEFYAEIDNHFAKRKQVQTCMETLAQRTAQFRAIERRLLTRFKDKTPTPLTNLDMLLEGTYKQVLGSCDQVDIINRELERSGANLSCIVRLLLLLVRLSLTISEEEVEKLESALTPIVQSCQEQGWEETTDAGLTFLLRTALAKPGRENQGATPITLDYPKEVTRLKKHVSSVVDRINKGGKIHDITVMPDSSPFVHEVTQDEAFDKEALEVVGKSVSNEKEITPVGTRFGESGERTRSARIRSARSARSTRSSRSSRPSSRASVSSEDDDIPPDGPVDLDQLDKDMPPLLPVQNYKKVIESPQEIFPNPEKSEEDIW